MEFDNLMVGEESPKEWAFSHSAYVLSALFKTRYIENTKMIQKCLRTDRIRTCQNYGLLCCFVDLIFDEFPEEMERHGITREAWFE